MKPTVINKRRFTCLSPHLVRVEFAPDAHFEDRRSIVAYPPQRPLAFASRTQDSGWTVLATGAMQIRSRHDADACDRTNLEIRWDDGRLMQFWRPGDRDYQNLGGTLRSLDRYVGASCRLDGVHPATMAAADASATNWPAWIQCEVDPPYEELHSKPPENFNRGHWAQEVQADRNDGRYLERTWNWYRDARKFSPGVLSAAGYYFLNDSESAVLDEDDFPVERRRPGYQDWYFFAYGKNYRQALRDLRLLSGPAPLPTQRSFGIIFSRWPAFTEAEVVAMAHTFRENGYPLATLVMDMEWHREGWGHWDFNPELIPDPQKFFALCREHGLEVTFNDHPLDVREDDSHFAAYLAAAGPDCEVRERPYQDQVVRMAKIDICDKTQNRAFREVCHQHIMDLGLDYWWNDGSRGEMSGTSGQLVCNKTFFEEAQRHGKRGMLLARHGGLGSHRYGGFFTGDANSDWEVLRLQVEFNIRAAGAGVGHVSHDIGGFMLPSSQLVKNTAGTDVIDPVRYLRWLQFGVFGPLLRFHSAPGCGSRLPYDYDSELGGACRHWLRVRHSLLPYIYTAARCYHETGVPITRGLFLEAPLNAETYRYDQYYFGPDLVVAPMVSADHARTLYLPPGDWWQFESAALVSGGGELTRDVALDDFPVYVRAGSIIPRRDPDGDVHAGHIAQLWLDVYPGSNGTAELYEDDGRSTGYERGEFCRTRFTLHCADAAMTLTGRVTDGAPQGADRAIAIDLSLAHPPLAAKSGDGADLEIAALPEAGRYRIVLPRQAAAEPFAVTIEAPDR